MKNTIKIERAKHSLTQDQLAKKIGVSRQTIHAMEKGKYAPSTILALKLAFIFGVDIKEIFSLEDTDWET